MGNNDSFVFYGSWLEAIEGYREDFGDEYADELVKAIVYYGITGEIVSNKKSIIGYINGNVAPLIDKSKERYKKACENGQKGGRKKILEGKDDEIRQLRAAGFTAAQIGTKFGVSDKTVRRSDGWSIPELDKNGQNKQSPEDKCPDKCPDNCPDGQNLYYYQYQYEQKDNLSVLPSDFPIEELLKTGWSYQQLIYGFNQKTQEEWDQYGYGLFYKEDFKKQVQKQLEVEINKEQKLEQVISENDKSLEKQLNNEKMVIQCGNNSNQKQLKLIDLNSI